MAMVWVDMLSPFRGSQVRGADPCSGAKSDTALDSSLSGSPKLLMETEIQIEIR